MLGEKIEKTFPTVLHRKQSFFSVSTSEVEKKVGEKMVSEVSVPFLIKRSNTVETPLFRPPPIKQAASNQQSDKRLCVVFTSIK